METYDITNDFLEIVAGTTNTINPAYMEAANNIEKDTTTGLGYLKNFITSIEEISSKSSVKDTRITSSKGNIKSFVGYENIKTAIDFLNKNLPGIPTVKDCVTVFDMLEKYQPQFTDAYDKNVRLVILEYENAVYLLVTSLSMVMANNMDVVTNGTEIRIQKKSATTFGVIPKTMKDLAKQMSNRSHKDYLEQMIKSVNNSSPKSIEESTSFMESSVSDALSLVNAMFSNIKKLGASTKSIFKSVKNSLFGIVPLIRSVIYLRYKKKADHILALEQQVVFIQRNIEQLENIKTMDPAKKAEIIKKQKAVCEAYKKKAEKLRAQLCENEKEAATELKDDNPNMKNVSDDDFVLENGTSVEDLFTESGKNFKTGPRKGLPKTAKRINGSKSNQYVDEARKDKLNDINSNVKRPAKATFNMAGAEEKVKKALDDLFEETKTKSIRLRPGKMNKTDSEKKRTATKIGGIPYWPKNMAYPQFKDRDMILLAQLNFSELPRIPGYPTTGIMQFFVDGATWEDVGSKARIKVAYHSKIVPEEERLGVNIARTTLSDLDNDHFPIRGVYYPKAEAQDVGINVTCSKYDLLLCKHLNKQFNTSWAHGGDIPKNVYDIIWKLMPTGYAGCRIGGHPYFTQNDVRSYNKGIETLLLQLDSEDGMMWGDCGVANFFISKSNLTSKKFDGTVFFNWDCM